MSDAIKETFDDVETTGDDLDTDRNAFEENRSTRGGYSAEERVIVWLRRAREELDAAHAIPGISKWGKTAGLTKEQNVTARRKHNMAHRAVEYAVGLLRHSEFQGKLTPDQHAEATALLAAAKETRGY